MTTVYEALNFVLYLYVLALLMRMVFSWVMVATREWRPRGVMLFLAEGSFTITDPPIKAVRKILPPVQVGNLRIDLAFLVVFLALTVLSSTLGYLALGTTR